VGIQRAHKRGVRVCCCYHIGVFLTGSGRRRTVPEMIECATMASEGAKRNIRLPYVLYTEEVNQEIAKNERIEAQMEEALANGEFKLFLQPKLNVKHDRIDSAEALVRWYDPEKGEYRFPGAFIGLFETNGFIIKLDKFIYLEVLKYLHHAVERGEKVVPISVNVSRVTAAEEDFLDFYIGNKKKYGIGDGFITLELTESFAVENYEKIQDLVGQLHQNGIRCSMDDFGSGYSSFNILKQVNFDELKLDRLFLTPGSDPKRSDAIIRTVIRLAHDLGISVVQEGVETEEMFNSVVEMGCEVVQGYYYAKAISLEEYRVFLTTNTSIKYKAKVK
jgi:EAL domain-containing protein (putative c-di-GMP-specific phosphodiesterase class I)